MTNSVNEGRVFDFVMVNLYLHGCQGEKRSIIVEHLHLRYFIFAHVYVILTRGRNFAL
jgi:hypothetical protein